MEVDRPQVPLVRSRPDERWAPRAIDSGAEAGDLQLGRATLLLRGDVDPATDTGDPAESVAAGSASDADTTGVMRRVGDAYLYNLRVPAAPANSPFTVRIRPFSDSTAAVYAVLKIKR